MKYSKKSRLLALLLALICGLTVMGFAEELAETNLYDPAIYAGGSTEEAPEAPFAADAEELEARVKEALEGAARTPERREAFRAVAEDVFALARAFAGMDGADAREAARLLMEDAGAAEETERNLRRAVDRLSVEALFEAFGIRTGD